MRFSLRWGRVQKIQIQIKKKNNNQNSKLINCNNNDTTNELTIKKSNLKNLLCSPDKKSKYDLAEFYAEKSSQRKSSIDKESKSIKRFKTNCNPYIGDDIKPFESRLLAYRGLWKLLHPLLGAYCGDHLFWKYIIFISLLNISS